MDENREGFRKQSSTGRYIARLTANIQNAVRSKMKPIAIFLHYSKLFASVWQKKLLWKLKDKGIRGRMWTTMAKFLVGRTIIIKLDNFISDSFNMISGEPRGSVFSPALFSLYVCLMAALVQFRNRPTMLLFSLQGQIFLKA